MTTTTSAETNAQRSTSKLISQLGDHLQNILDGIVPAQKRQGWWKQSKDLAACYPKLTVFLLTNLVISGGPLLLFGMIALSAIAIGLAGAVVAAFVATLMFMGVALLFALVVVLPTLCVTTFAAAIISAWALLGYSVYRLLSRPEKPTEAMAKSIEQKLKSLARSTGQLSHQNNDAEEEKYVVDESQLQTRYSDNKVAASKAHE